MAPSIGSLKNELCYLSVLPYYLYFFPSSLQSLVGGQDGPKGGISLSFNLLIFEAHLQDTHTHTPTHRTRRKLNSLWLDNNLPLGELAQPLGTSL